MDITWLIEYGTSKKGATTDYKVEWSAHRLLIRDKMFAMIGTDKEGRDIITLKLAPEQNYRLQEQYPGQIVPGYYANKIHWSSFYLDSNLDEELIRNAIDEAYELVLKNFSKKVQNEILN